MKSTKSYVATNFKPKSIFGCLATAKIEFGINFLIYPVEKIKQSVDE